MNDLGYTFPAWVRDIAVNDMSSPISTERISQIDSDLALLLNPFSEENQSFEAARAKMDAILPNWERFMPAARDGRLIHVEGRASVVPTFAAAHRILDALERQLVK